MKVWLLTVGEPLPILDHDIPRLLRTGTLAKRLVELGHEVCWWTSAFDHYQKRHYCNNDATFTWAGGTIRLLKSVGYRRNVSLARIVEHSGVARKFRVQALKCARPDVILVSLPTIELAREAVRYGINNGVPVLVDVRDLWPDLLIDIMSPRFRWLSRSLLWPMLRDTRYALSCCSGIVGISDGYLDWGLRYAKRVRSERDAMIPLGYVSPISSNENLSLAGERLCSLGVSSNKKICWYIGSFGRQYDLAPVLAAARKLLQTGRTDIQFVISGEGELGGRWRDQATGLENVIFTGWIGGDEINWMRSNAAIGLQPYVANAPQGLANKLFEYLSAGIPVVSSLCGENKTLLDKHRCGLTYRAGDAIDCAAKILQLVDEESERLEMGYRGKTLFEEQFDGCAVFDRLAAHLEAVSMCSYRKES